MTPRLSVIIPVFNQWLLTKQCLESLAEHQPPFEVEIIVVDNGSTDETPRDLPHLGRSLFGDRFILLSPGENLGYGPGSNAGAQQATADLLFFLNNDTVVRAGWAEPLLRAFSDEPGLGAAGSLLLYPNNDRVQHAGVTFTPEPTVSHLYEYFPATHPVVIKPRDLQAVTGAAMAVPGELFLGTGGFDPEYRNGFEDLDLCCMLRQNNWKIRCVPQSVIYHLTSQTPGRFDADADNSRRFVARWENHLEPDLHLFLAADGYEMALSPALVPYATLPQARAIELDSALQNATDPQDLLTAITDEPLWMPGYDRLAGWLETHNAWLDALQVRLWAVHFFPLEENYLRLLRAATRARNTEVLSSASEAMAKYHRKTAQPAKLRAKAAHMALKTRDMGSGALAQLYETWLPVPSRYSGT